MNESTSSTRIISRLMLKLLPVHILLSVVGMVNGLISSFFATNYVGVEAMTAVGLYNPINTLLLSISTMMVGGAGILCGKYMGQNRQDKLKNVFSLDIAVSALIALGLTVLFALLSVFDLTGFLAGDPNVRPLFNMYLLGQSIGLLPMLLGNQLSTFLSIENKEKRTLAASIIYIISNLGFNYLFVEVLDMQAFGLALASSLGMWIFFAVQALYFVSGRSIMRFSAKNLDWSEGGSIVKTGFPGAASNGYQTLRGFALNYLITVFVGSVGISAFATAQNIIQPFWAIPTGMLAVSRLMISVSIGEEDRKSVADVMRVMMKKFIPIMCVFCAALIIFAKPITGFFYHDPSEEVYDMTVWGLRLLPLCMPFSILYMHYVCYGQASGKNVLVHILSLLDGVVCNVAFAALTIRFLGINSVYLSSLFNGFITTIVIVGYAFIKNRRMPKNMDDLMAFPDGFGVGEDERMDLTVRSMDEVVSIARKVQSFCEEKGTDARRACIAGLAMEEMAGNIVGHGFTKDKKQHSVDVRVVHKGDEIILRLRDDCVPFDPAERSNIIVPDDPAKNVGIRMIFRMAKKVEYQNILGLNVLTMRI